MKFASWIRKRQEDIANEEDVSCEKCLEMREMNFPRPTCEECGLIELSSINQEIYLSVITYFPSLVTRNSDTQWALNMGVFNLLAEELSVDNKLKYLKRVQIIISSLLAQPEENND